MKNPKLGVRCARWDTDTVVEIDAMYDGRTPRLVTTEMFLVQQQFLEEKIKKYYRTKKKEWITDKSMTMYLVSSTGS